MKRDVGENGGNGGRGRGKGSGGGGGGLIVAMATHKSRTNICAPLFDQSEDGD